MNNQKQLSRGEREDRQREIKRKMEGFCDGCEYIEECGFSVPYGSSGAYLPDYTCEADLDPEDLGCRRHDDYMELLEEYDAIKESFAEEANAVVEDENEELGAAV